jgi:hypothetical protein
MIGHIAREEEMVRRQSTPKNRRVYIICNKKNLNSPQTPSQPALLLLKHMIRRHHHFGIRDLQSCVVSPFPLSYLKTQTIWRKERRRKVTYSFSLPLALPLLFSSISTGSLTPNSTIGGVIGI